MGIRKKYTLDELKAKRLDSYYHWRKYQVEVESLKRREEKKKEFQEYLEEENKKYADLG